MSCGRCLAVSELLSSGKGDDEEGGGRGMCIGLSPELATAAYPISLKSCKYLAINGVITGFY